jgi:CelD/BcsL family acetyltransferase involved in cellulose biosynthesis
VSGVTAEVWPATRPVEPLRDAWDALFSSRPHQPCVSFAWATALMRNHLAARSDWFIVVLRRNERIVGIVPMMTVEERLLGSRVVTLQPIHELYKTHGDLLLSEPGEELVNAWLSALRQVEARWDLLRMSRILERDALAGSLEHALRRQQLRYRLRVEAPSFHLPLPASYAEYLTQRSGKFRNHLKRAEKKLLALGKLELIRTATAAALDRDYAELLAIERHSWKHEHGTAISAVSHQAGFYRDLCQSAMAAGMLHLTLLSLQGAAIAYNLGLVVNGCYFYLKTSYRQEHRLNGAATVGRAKLIESIIAEGVTEFDFPGEPYEWEQQWTGDLRWHRSLLVYNETLTGRVVGLANALKDCVRRGRDERKVVFADARELKAPDAQT